MQEIKKFSNFDPVPKITKDDSVCIMVIQYNDKDRLQKQQVDRMCEIQGFTKYFSFGISDDNMHTLLRQPDAHYITPLLHLPLKGRSEKGLELVKEALQDATERMLNYIAQTNVHNPEAYALFERHKELAQNKRSFFSDGEPVRDPYGYPLFALCYPPEANTFLFVKFDK